MENISLKDLTDLVNSGSNLALIACAWFIHKAEARWLQAKAVMEEIRDQLKRQKE